MIIVRVCVDRLYLKDGLRHLKIKLTKNQEKRLLVLIGRCIYSAERL